jgi:F-type H+-transporting ATPase subunit epsilon
MAMTMHIDVVSAEEMIYSGTIEFVSAPAENGEIGILPRHAPLLTRIQPGCVRIKVANSDEELLLFVSGGILEVQPHVVTILADTAIRGGDLDETKAEEAKARAMQLIQKQGSTIDFARAQAELAEAMAQLHTIRRLKQRSH